MDAALNILTQGGPFLAALVGIAIAALANGMETGLYRLNRVRLRLRADAGSRRAGMLLGLLGDLRGLIITCLIGYNGGVYLATYFLATLVASRWQAGAVRAEIVTTAILAPIFFVFTDVTPKSLFTYEADRLMVRLAPVLKGAYTVLRAVLLVGALKGVSTLVLRVGGAPRAGDPQANPFQPRQRLRALLREGAAEGVITSYQDELVEKVLSLRDRQVRQVMIPLAKAAAVEQKTRRADLLEELRRHSYTRLPVWEERRERIVGIVHIRDVLAADESLDLAAVMNRDLVVLAPEMPVSQALFRMQRKRAAMAVVQDPKGRALGILTIKDLVEEIVGELPVW
jgi:CBS domain containing-hemolysin-like protein